MQSSGSVSSLTTHTEDRLTTVSYCTFFVTYNTTNWKTTRKTLVETTITITSFITLIKNNGDKLSITGNAALRHRQGSHNETPVETCIPTTITHTPVTTLTIGHPYRTVTSLVVITTYMLPPAVEPTDNPPTKETTSPFSESLPTNPGSKSNDAGPVTMSDPTLSNTPGSFVTETVPRKTFHASSLRTQPLSGTPSFSSPLSTPEAVLSRPLSIPITQLPDSFFNLPSELGIRLPNGETLRPGSATIIDGKLLSLPATGGFVIAEGTRSIPLTPVASNTITLPNGEILTPGMLITVAGVPISLSPDGTQVVINGSTSTLNPTATGFIASYIWSEISAVASSDHVHMPSGGMFTSTNGLELSNDGTKKEPVRMALTIVFLMVFLMYFSLC